MSELMQDVDPGMLPPRTRAIFSQVGLAIGQGWRPGQLAEKLGVAPSWLSELLGELRTALGLLSGVFPTPSDDAYLALRASIAAAGVQVPVVVDEHGIIDGRARARALDELARICTLEETAPELLATVTAILEMPAETEEERRAEKQARAQANDLHGEQAVDDALTLRPDRAIVKAALERRWEDPPVDRRHGLTRDERRELSVQLNAHRRHLKRGQLRQVVEIELMVSPERSDGAIARLVGCSRQWVQQIRQQLADDERLLDNPQPEDEVQVLAPLKPVAQLGCPHCHHELAVLRRGKEFRLEELPAGDQE